MSLLNNVQTDFEKYNHYRKQYRLKCKSIYMNNKLIDKIVGKQCLYLYKNVIYPVIKMPYMFSDHKNKSFNNQYSYLQIFLGNI